MISDEMLLETDPYGARLRYVGPAEQMLPPDVAAAMIDAAARLRAGDGPQTIEYTFSPSPAARRFEARLRLDTDGRIRVRVRDTKDRIKAEADLAESLKRLSETEARFRTMANSAPVLLWMANKEGLCDFFNAGWMEFTGRPLEQEVGNGWAEGVHPEDFQRCMMQYMTSFVARESFSMEYRLRRHDGEYRWIYDQGVPRFDANGEFAGFIGSCVDVHDAREFRDALRRLNADLGHRSDELTDALAEKEVLLREAHHRVKNSLQLISSMLNMQARQLHDGGSRSALAECQDRIQAIALIHERLYQSTDLSHLPFRPYAESLVSYLFNSAQTSPHAPIDLEMNLAEVSLRVDRAVPCALILNELVTNALKHAFPADRAGKISVQLEEADGHRLSLVVRDDGAGLPAEFDVRKTRSLGLTLVTTLADQLDAQLIVDRNKGTAFQLVFDSGA